MSKEGKINDPELESLLSAYRKIQPTPAESEKWKAALTGATKKNTAKVIRPNWSGHTLVRSAAKVALVASIGFVMGIGFMKVNSIDTDQRQPEQLFAQNVGTSPPPPVLMDEQREVIVSRF